MLVKENSGSEPIPFLINKKRVTAERMEMR